MAKKDPIGDFLKELGIKEETTGQSKPKTRRKSKKNTNTSNNNGANLGFEAKLWEAANKLRGHLDAAEYKHVVLGLIFLKYLSDAFEEKRKQLEKELADPESPWFIKEPEARYETLEDRDEYRAENVFYVPPRARWSYIRERAKQPEIGQIIDDAMVAIEKENPSLKGVLPKIYAKPELDKRRLGELVDLISDIGLWDHENRSKDILGRVYEYFLGQFASAEGRKGGEFYTPRCIVRLLVEMIEPYQGRVYDPCCGSGGMFVQSEEFIKAHGGRIGDISIYGQESNPTTWRLAKMNLAIRGIEANLGPHAADTFHNDLHPTLKADFILANPPFNQKDWGQEALKGDVRWKFGVPPANNANFAWVQHIIHHLSPVGIAGFVLANGSLSSNQGGEGEIRKKIIEADLVDCIVALPPQLFYSTQIPACLWFIARDKSGKPTKGGKPLRDRRGEVLFIDARKMGVMVDRVHRELTDEEIKKIARTYHAWRGEEITSDSPLPGGEGLGVRGYKDIPGFCKSATIEEIREHDYILTPGRYVGVEIQEEDDEVFEEKMKRLVAELETQFAESTKLEEAIRRNLRELGFL
ncbi:class I SAM-dependent DNA methyltransferase [Thermodesulfatator atlanticus]|uniref:class I SAM-dependent DNA methyltransferase n=1 Tax=Thermodesulfatator atlanticus TaxID=501497 RepID=UPI0003B51AA5|nr:class I SAM-dependent DNA methyltransferase [Thermodesulfatator atlanticus]